MPGAKNTATVAAVKNVVADQIHRVLNHHRIPRHHPHPLYRWVDEVGWRPCNAQTQYANEMKF
jgi:hypothetical protein